VLITMYNSDYTHNSDCQAIDGVMAKVYIIQLGVSIQVSLACSYIACRLMDTPLQPFILSRSINEYMSCNKMCAIWWMLTE